MQKINIKKLTKEKLAEMYAEAKSAYDAAMDDEERRVRELEEQSKELIALTEKLEANEKALDEMTALYKNANHAAKDLRGKIEHLDKALSEATEKREAAEKAFMKMHATIEGLLKRLEAQKDISEDCHQSLKWCMAHPWRNLWRCVKEHFRF